MNLIGRLVADPVLETAPDGGHRCTMRVAVPRVGRSGLREPGVVYVEVVATGLRAHDLAAGVTSGMRIGVSGRLELDEWTAPGGEPQSRYEVMADQIEVLDSPPREEPAADAA